MRRLDIAGPVGSAHLERVRSGWSIELEHGGDVSAAIALLRDAVDAVREKGGHLARLWAREGDPIAIEAGHALEFTLERELLQLRRPLPVEDPDDLPVRAFVPGRDEVAWLDVNNRAFDWHPEQGGMTLDDLAARQAEPWFDPAGFLLHEIDGRLVGFCWTKLHAASRPVLGEIFAIAVDPAAGVRGLGRPLTIAGLAHLQRDGAQVGMLYVDATNAPARRLYDGLGFSTHHVDRAYVRELVAAA